MWPRVAILVVLSSAIAIPLLSQSTGSLNVLIRDKSGAPITSGVTVRLQSSAGFDRTLSDISVFHNLPFGPYRLTVTVPGFEPYAAPVEIRSRVPLELTVTLEVAAQRTTVEVGAEATRQALDTESSGTRHQLNIAGIEQMPVSPASRGLEPVLLSFPGFAANANGAIHPRGAHNQMTFVIDGMPVSDQLTGSFANAIDPSIAETLELYTGNVPAEFGNKVSGVATIHTRSGLGASRRFAGSTQTAVASFDTLSSLTQFTGGSDKFGYFTSFNAIKTNRYLDQVSLDNLHNGGNSERAFGRLDWLASPRDSIRISAMAGRSSFQLANLRSQHANGQQQRQELRDISISTSWLRTLDARSTFETQASFRNVFAELFASPGDTPVTAAQSRRLTTWNLGTRYSRVEGRHNLRAGADWQRFPVREHFSFGITHPAFNDPQSEGYVSTLRAYDLTRGGRLFQFAAVSAGRLASSFVQDNIRFGGLLVSLGLRYDNYRFLVQGSQLQPRVGLSYHIGATGTVLRASYNRTYQTPPNENLLLSNSEAAAALVPEGVRNALGGAYLGIRPERQNVYETGLQQSLGKFITLDAAYYHKQSTDLQDNDNFLNTGIIFPTSLARSRVNGAEGRIRIAPGSRINGSVAFTHYRAVVTPPFTGGLFLGSAAVEALSAGPFIIDHDQKLGMQSNIAWQLNRSWWVSGSVRYDSGLVSNPSDPSEVATDPDYADLLPYVNLASSPARVKPRTVGDIAIGYRRLSDSNRGWEAVLQVSNLTNTTALYNFQSIFVGTRLISPRAASLRLKWMF